MTELGGKRVLVTGGAGFIGSHVVDLLVGEGCAEITAVDNMLRGRRENVAGALRDASVRLVQGDIRNRALMAELIVGTDIVFHLAAIRITQCAAEPRLAMDVMVQATFDLLELCVEHGVKKIVASSSASVYGMADEFPTPEGHHSYNNRTIYGAAKAFNEGLLRSFHDMHGLNYVGHRYFNVYGPRMDVHGKYTEVLIRWMERLDRGEQPLIFGDGSQTMDFVDVRDVARANIIGATSAVSDEVFNIGSGVETSLGELARLLAKAMGSNLDPELAPARATNPVPRRLASTEKAERVLGFRSRVSLEEGLNELVRWWRSERRAESPPARIASAE